jgi:hypothetical protein
MTAPKIFGTDGVRGTANIEPVTAETALKLGRAAAHVFKNVAAQSRGRERHKIVIGKDTRLSGYMIENAISAGVLSMGVDVLFIGPLPTPGVAYVTRSLRADAGIVITGVAQSVRRQRHQILPRGRLQTRRQDRATDRATRLHGRHRKHSPDRLGHRQSRPHR